MYSMFLQNFRYPQNSTANIRPSFNFYFQLVTPVRSFGGGTIGLQKSIVIFGFMGGITVFMALAAQLLKANTVFALIAVMSLICYLFFAETNMARHANCGTKAFQGRVQHFLH